MSRSGRSWSRWIPDLVRRSLRGSANLKRILTNIIWLYADRVLRMGVGLLVGVWLARYLGPGEFGLYNFALSLVSLFAAVTALGLQGIVVRDIVNQPEGARQTLGTAFVLQIVAGVLGFVLVVGVIQIMRPDDALLKSIVAILGISLVFKAGEVAKYWFESQVQSKYAVWAETAVLVMLAGIKIALILLEAPLIGFVWAALAETVAISLALLCMFAWKEGSLVSCRPSLVRARSLLRDSWPVIISGVAVVIYMKIDQVMLGQMIDDEAVGIYSAAIRLSEVWYFMGIGIIVSVVPTLIESKQESEILYQQRAQRLYDLMVLLAIGMALPLTILSDPLVRLIFGDAYAAAGGVLAVHLWAGIFVFLGKASSHWFFVNNRQMLILQRSILGAVANVGLNFWLIPQYGALGAAWATVIAYVVISFLYDAVQRETRSLFLMKLHAFNVFRGAVNVWPRRS